MTTRNHVRGFTLIELLVVIVIVATVLSIAVLSLGIVGDDRDLKTERARLVSLIETVQDEAMMQGREFGIEFMVSGYRFVEFDALTRRWMAIPGDDLFRQRELPEGLEFDLYIDAKRVVLRDEPLPLGDPDKPAMNQGTPNYAPHLYVFASGEATVFELHVRRPGTDQELALRGDIFGGIEFVEDES